MTAPTTGIAPYLSVRDGGAAISYYEKALKAELLERYDFQDKLGHATLKINDALVMLADEFPDHEAQIGNVAPPTLGDRTTFTINLYVTDADEWFDRSIAEGASVVRACSDEFFGRHGKVRDPFGHVWSFVALKEQPET
jgi:PhnB protein